MASSGRSGALRGEEARWILREFSGLGTDFNGLPGQPSPRFGDLACWEKGKTSRPPLVYPFRDYWGDLTSCMKAGERELDFDTDGLAQYGLLPDLIRRPEGRRSYRRGDRARRLRTKTPSTTTTTLTPIL